MKKIWLIPLPDKFWVEDLAELAKKNNLELMLKSSAKGIKDDQIEKNPPELTLKKKYSHLGPKEPKPEEKPKPKAKAKAKPKATAKTEPDPDPEKD